MYFQAFYIFTICIVRAHVSCNDAELLGALYHGMRCLLKYFCRIRSIVFRIRSVVLSICSVFCRIITVLLTSFCRINTILLASFCRTFAVFCLPYCLHEERYRTYYNTRCAYKRLKRCASRESMAKTMHYLR